MFIHENALENVVCTFGGNFVSRCNVLRKLHYHSIVLVGKYYLLRKICAGHLRSSDVIMGAMASQITGVPIIYSIVCSGVMAVDTRYNIYTKQCNINVTFS